MDATNVHFLLHPMYRQMNAVHLRRYAVLNIFAIVVLLLTPKQAVALEPWIPTAQELNSLPPYCRAKFERQHEEVWKQTLGHDYMHIHHYCAGLNFLNRYYRNHDNAQFKLGRVVGEMGYMIDKSSPSFSLLPDIYLTRGKAFMLLKRTQEGTADIFKALELNPKLLHAYLALIDFYRGLNVRDKALDYAVEGLRHLPDSKYLQKIYDDLGGIQPYPEPYEKKEASNPQASENPAQTGAEFPAVTQVPAGDSPTPPNGNQTAKDQAANNPSRSTPIGSPTNPWCRFCTDSDSKPQ